MRVVTLACIVLMTLLIGAEAFAAGGSDLRRIVVFHDGVSTQLQKQVVAQSGSRLVRLLSLINGASIALPAVGTDSALAYLRAHYAVEAVYADPVVKAHGATTVVANGAGGDGAGGDGAGGDGAGGDGAGGDQVVLVTPTDTPVPEVYPWGVARIGAPDVQQGPRPVMGDEVKVAVFDTGIDRTHPDLAPNLIGGFNAIADDNSDAYADDNGHGTAMAGIIAARLNRTGVVGVAPRALLYAVKVLDKNGRGHTSDTLYALSVIADRTDIRLINMSYGTALATPDLAPLEPLLKAAVQRITQLGKILVASRGNGCTTGAGGIVANGAGGDGAGGDGAGGDGAGGDGAGGDGAGGDAGCDPHAVRYPAVYGEVITVGATTTANTVPSYSLWGVDVVAPGGNSGELPLVTKILTTNVGGGYGLIIGTSPAAAHVTGAVALALQLRRTLTPAQAQDLLRQTARPLSCCTDDQQGAGLIDVEAMVDALEKSPGK
jgi:subtilisin